MKTEGLAARFSSPDNPPGHQSRPNSTSSKSSLHTPDLPAQPGPEDSRKRAASPLVSPNPGKKPSRPASSSGDGSTPDEAKRCLDEINMGFDRLVSMASELDKRRKSAENSPNQTGSPRKGATDLRLTDASFDPNILAQKFKAGLMQGGGSSGGANPAVSLHVRSPLPSTINNNKTLSILFSRKNLPCRLARAFPGETCLSTTSRRDISMRNIRGSRRRLSATWTSRDGRARAGLTGSGLATTRETPGLQELLPGQVGGREVIMVAWRPGDFIQTSTGIQVGRYQHQWVIVFMVVFLLQEDPHRPPRATLPTTPTDNR